MRLFAACIDWCPTVSKFLYFLPVAAFVGFLAALLWQISNLGGVIYLIVGLAWAYFFAWCIDKED